MAAVLVGLMMPASAMADHSPQVGEQRSWVALDDSLPGTGLYRKNFVFRGAGKYIEVWVAKGFSAPAGRAGAYDLEFPSNERARARGFD
ncbi:MAG: hypothetical protein H0U03_02865, partial [Actinobacteria bacterium]|nr:hypothetical protein [Actinomycetota bacterium]